QNVGDYIRTLVKAANGVGAVVTKTTDGGYLIAFAANTNQWFYDDEVSPVEDN
ncbi:hypothetical protein LCGC14_3109480, partial [marine sediment metagenome]